MPAHPAQLDSWCGSCYCFIFSCMATRLFLWPLLHINLVSKVVVTRSLTLKWSFTSKILKQREVIGVYVHQWKLPIWKGRRLLLQACITRQSFHQGTSSLHYSNNFPVFTPTWTEETESLEESSLIQEKLLEIMLGPYGYFLYIIDHVDIFSFLGERICAIFIKVWKYHKQ